MTMDLYQKDSHPPQHAKTHLHLCLKSTARVNDSIPLHPSPWMVIVIFITPVNVFANDFSLIFFTGDSKGYLC